jgi:hypothetical protein
MYKYLFKEVEVQIVEVTYRPVPSYSQVQYNIELHIERGRECSVSTSCEPLVHAAAKDAVYIAVVNSNSNSNSNSDSVSQQQQ